MKLRTTVAETSGLRVQSVPAPPVNHSGLDAIAVQMLIWAPISTARSTGMRKYRDASVAARAIDM